MKPTKLFFVYDPTHHEIRMCQTPVSEIEVFYLHHAASSPEALHAFLNVPEYIPRVAKPQSNHTTRENTSSDGLHNQNTPVIALHERKRWLPYLPVVIQFVFQTLPREELHDKS